MSQVAMGFAWGFGFWWSLLAFLGCLVVVVGVIMGGLQSRYRINEEN